MMMTMMTPEEHSFEEYVFHRYHWFTGKKFPFRLCA